MAIGALGPIVFEVSDKKPLTFNGMTCDVSGRWTEHKVMGVKPKPEFLGPSNQKITMPITLSAGLGVCPRKMLEMVERMVESGDAEYLIINCKPAGRHPFRLTASSETWGAMYRHGELAKATKGDQLRHHHGGGGGHGGGMAGQLPASDPGMENAASPYLVEDWPTLRKSPASR